ncbi:MAG: hypothetical protein ACKOTB_02925 [Planctomycetia bacterium]
MRVLLTNNTLAARAGSELYVLDVARELKRLGHMPVAYSPALGAVADCIRAENIPVIDDLAALPFRPDVIHGQHHVETMTAVASLPGVPAVYFCHGVAPGEEMPPVFPRIFRYVAVDAACRERVVREAGAESTVRVVLNFANLEQFRPRAPLPARPARALVFSNEAKDANFARVVREACGRHGITLDVIGRESGNAAAAPHERLPHYDLVFAKARSAIESLAVGCAVVICGTHGLGPMVSTANVEELRAWNFGFRTMTIPHGVDAVDAAIRGYDPADAAEVSGLVRQHADVRDAVRRIVAIYDEAILEGSRALPDHIAEVRAMGAYLGTLDTVLKHAAHGTRIAAPPTRPPDTIALPPRSDES